MDFTAIYYDKNYKIIRCEILKGLIESTVKEFAEVSKPENCKKIVIRNGSKVTEQEKISSLIYMYKLGASTRYERYVLRLAILQLKSGAWKSNDVENWVSETLKKFRQLNKK